MSAIKIEIESPLNDDAARLIEGSEAALREHYAEDECFSFTAAELDKPDIMFFVARIDTQAVGCVALVNYESYGEIKRLYVPNLERGKGIAKRLMDHIEDYAQRVNLPLMRLETGEELAAAVAIYKQRGYHIRGPFGDYEAHPASLFMEKALS